MLRYVLKRILWLIPVIICVSLIVYTLIELAPGTIIDAMISEYMTQEDIEELRKMYDLDRPMLYRYGKYMINLLQGDLGISDVTQIDVWETYMTRLPNTLILAFSALVIGSVIAIPMGIIAARRSGTLIDNATSVFTLIGMSMPGFWLGLLLLLIFSLRLGWLPGGGMRHGIRSLVLPAICSGLLLMATATRQTRSSMLEVLNADFLRTARAKGVPEKSVIRKHALGNAWIPILATLGTALSVSLAGSAVVEAVFAWPGVGLLTVNAVMQRDVTMTLGCVIMTTFLYVFVQLVVDLLFAFVDPRIKAQYSSVKKRKRPPAETPASERPVTERREIAAAEANNSKDSKTEEPKAAQPVLNLGNKPAYLSAETGANASVEDKTNEEKPAERQEAIVVSEVASTGEAAASSNAVSASAVEKELITKKYKKRSQLGEIFHRIRRNKGALAGLAIITILFLTFLGSLFISFEAATSSNVPARFTSPNLQYPFGTDNLGRNALLRVVYGTRYSLAIGFGVVGIATLVGVTFGSIAGYFGKHVDDIIMRVSDILASIPGMLLGMVIVTVLGQSLRNLIIAVGITSIPIFIRITRASILTVRGNEFVEAAKAIGISSPRIIFTQVLPNGLAPIIVTITASLGIAIIVAASLSFIGFGVPVPHPEWGAMIASGREFARSAPWLMTFPGLCIMVTVLAFNLLGDGLRDALDPKLKGTK